MDHVLKNATKNDVQTDPFPYIVLHDVLDDEFCLKLLDKFPTLEQISKGEDLRENRRFDYRTDDSLYDETIDSVWKDFLVANTSPDFFKKFIELFGESIKKEYPNFEEKVGLFNSLTSGVHGKDSLDDYDILLDANISVNTPATTKPTSVKVAHIDNADKLYGGLFYLRHPDDDSIGGDLEVYRLKKGDKPTLYNSRQHGARLVEKKHLDVVATIPYKRNTLVLFLNTPTSLHGVTVRSVPNTTRYFMNLIGELEKPLFDTAALQESRLRGFLRRKIGV